MGRSLASRDFNLAALFLWITPFLAARSNRLAALANVFLVGFCRAFFKTALIFFLILWLVIARRRSRRSAFLAESVIGISNNLQFTIYNLQ